jgi:hypothetical protein
MLEAEGVAEGLAERLARAAHRSFVSFQREAAADGGSSRSWDTQLSERVVRRAWLAGAWVETRSGDQSELSALFGQDYQTARSRLEPLARGADPLFTAVGSSWTLVNVEAAFDYGSRHVTQLDLGALEETLQRVLGEVDPALEMPPSERWLAGVEAGCNCSRRI